MHVCKIALLSNTESKRNFLFHLSLLQVKSINKPKLFSLYLFILMQCFILSPLYMQHNTSIFLCFIYNFFPTLIFLIQNHIAIPCHPTKKKQNTKTPPAIMDLFHFPISLRLYVHQMSLTLVFTITFYHTLYTTSLSCMHNINKKAS